MKGHYSQEGTLSEKQERQKLIIQGLILSGWNKLLWLAKTSCKRKWSKPNFIMLSLLDKNMLVYEKSPDHTLFG